MANEGIFRYGPTPQQDVPILHQQLAVTAIPAYPSEWFDKMENAGAKPSISIPNIGGSNIAHLRHHLATHLYLGTANINLVKAFIMAKLDTISIRVPERWISFNRLICEADHLCTARNLVDIYTPPELTETGPETIIDPVADVHYMIYITGVYRINMAKNPDYKRKLQADLLGQLTNAGAANNININNIPLHYSSWINDENYVKLMALIDMYFMRFPNDPMARIRFGTLGTRWRDSGALMDLMFMAEYTSLTIPQLSRWCWFEKLLDELFSVNRPDQELDQAYSYAPYFMEFKLASKSKYSTSINPSLHFWVHAVGSLCGVERCPRSVNVGTFALPSITNISAVFAYALSQRTVAKQLVGRADERPVLPPPDEDINMDDRMPSTLNGLDWLTWYQDHQGAIPDVINEKARTATQAWTETRVKSIGRSLLNYPW